MPEQDQRNGHADVRTLRRFRPSRPARRHSFRQRPPHAPAGRRHRPTRRVAGSASDQGHPAHPTRARRLKRHLRTQHVTYPEAVGASFRTRVGHGPTTSDREHPRRDRARLSVPVAHQPMPALVPLTGQAGQVRVDLRPPTPRPTSAEHPQPRSQPNAVDVAARPIGPLPSTSASSSSPARQRRCSLVCSARKVRCALDQLADPQVPVITYEQQIRW
jgi:hypothetical protein